MQFERKHKSCLIDIFMNIDEFYIKRGYRNVCVCRQLELVVSTELIYDASTVKHQNSRCYIPVLDLKGSLSPHISKTEPVVVLRKEKHLNPPKSQLAGQTFLKLETVLGCCNSCSAPQSLVHYVNPLLSILNSTEQDELQSAGLHQDTEDCPHVVV